MQLKMNLLVAVTKSTLKTTSFAAFKIINEKFGWEYIVLQSSFVVS